MEDREDSHGDERDLILESMLSAVRKSCTRGEEVDSLSKGMSSRKIPLEE